MQKIIKIVSKHVEVILKTILISILRMEFLECKWNEFIQFIQFGIVGLTNTFISYFSYLVFYKLGCHYLIASMLSFVVSVTNSFYWNNKYVFKQENGKHRSILASYVKTFLSYAATGLVLANILLVIWVELLHLPELLGPIVSLLVTIPLNFILNKLWAFRNK